MQIGQYIRILLLAWTIQLKWLQEATTLCFVLSVRSLIVRSALVHVIPYCVAKHTFESNISCSRTLKKIGY
jgi:hypothetical protein